MVKRTEKTFWVSFHVSHWNLICIQVTMVAYNNFCFRNPTMVFWFGRSLSIIVYLGKIWYEDVILPKYIFFYEHWFIFLLIRILSCFKNVYDFFFEFSIIRNFSLSCKPFCLVGSAKLHCLSSQISVSLACYTLSVRHVLLS